MRQGVRRDGIGHTDRSTRACQADGGRPRGRYGCLLASGSNWSFAPASDRNGRATSAAWHRLSVIDREHRHQHASGRFLFNILGALRQMEREIIVERTRAGLIAAAARGRRGGRPAALDDSKIRAARAMLASGNMSAAEVAEQLGCAPTTLYRHLPGGRSALAQIEQAAA